MSSRALSLATVMLLVSCFAAQRAEAQATNLEAGKSPSQLFSQTCVVCHKSPRGLLRTVAPGSLTGFLRQHYTTSPEMAGVLASYLISSGATDTRYSAGQPKGAKEGAKEAAVPPNQLDRFGRPLHPKPAQEVGRPEGAKPEEQGQATAEHGPEGHKLLAKQRLGKRGKPGIEEPPKEPPKESAAKEEPAASEPPKDEKSKEEAAKTETAKTETAKTESGKDEGRPDAAKPAGEAKSSTTANAEPSKEGAGEQAGLRPDPVPPVTPAPAASAAPSATASTGPSSEPSEAPVPSQPAPAVTAAAPPLPPVAPAGPPAPPISQ